MKKLTTIFTIMLLALATQTQAQINVQYRTDGITYQYDTSLTKNDFCCAVVISPIGESSLMRYASNVAWDDGSTNPRTHYSNAGKIESYYSNGTINTVPSWYYQCSCEVVMQPLGTYEVNARMAMKDGTTKSFNITIATSTPVTLSAPLFSPTKQATSGSKPPKQNGHPPKH